VDWVQLISFHLKAETEFSLRNVVLCNINRTMFLDKDRTTDNVQKHNICTIATHFWYLFTRLEKMNAHNEDLQDLHICCTVGLIIIFLTRTKRKICD
jgi:hypothetical protein